MGRFTQTETGVVFSVDDSKDERYAGELYEPAKADSAPKKAPAKRTASDSDK